MARATGYAHLATGAKTAGAASSATAAARNSPVASPLTGRSQATSPCQSGAFVTGPPSYPGPLVAAREVGRISMPQQEDHREQHGDRGQPAGEGAGVIPPHVEPRIERVL